MRRIVIVMLTCLAVAAVFAAAPPRASALKLTTLEQQVIRLVNEQRADHGLPPLRAQGNLARAARGHSRAMARTPFFSHVSPNGQTLSDRAIASGYRPGGCSKWSVGETIAWGAGAFAVPEAIVKGWMKSPPHRRILLSSGFHDIGIGAAKGTYESSGIVLDSVTYFTVDVGLRRR